MASFSTVQAGDAAVSSNLNQFAEALSGQANIPIAVTGVNDVANYAFSVKNADGTNNRVFKSMDSSGNARIDISGASTAMARADPDGSGLSVIATLGHAQTLSSKTITASAMSLLGGLNTQRVPFCRIYQGSTVTTSSNTLQVLNFDTETIDNDGMHSTSVNSSRITCITAGVYNIFGHVEWAPNSSGIRQVAIKLNGGSNAIVREQRVAGAISGVMAQTIQTVYALVAGDYVTLEILQDGVANLGTGLNPVGQGVVFGAAFMGAQ